MLVSGRVAEIMISTGVPDPLEVGVSKRPEIGPASANSYLGYSLNSLKGGYLGFRV